jgi:hypothetical protein
MAIDDMTSCVAWADMNGVSSAAAAAGLQGVCSLRQVNMCDSRSVPTA